MKYPAWALVAVVLTLTPGCARTDWIERTLVTVDVTGVWEGTYKNPPGQAYSARTIVLVLEQQGQRVTGEITFLGTFASKDTSPGSAVHGTVNGDAFSFHDSSQSLNVELRVNGDEMTRSAVASGFVGQVSFRRRPQ
jgi:hypothetical protein